MRAAPPVLQPGEVTGFVRGIQVRASARATFDDPAATGALRRAVRLSSGPAPNQLLCFPAPLALCGPQQFTRLATGFRGLRELLVLHIPGFVGKEVLPATLDVAVENLATAVERARGEHGGAPVLAGYSTGGTFAYGLAGHLESIGVPVAGVVLFDAFPPGTSEAAREQAEALVMHLVNTPEWRPYLTDTRLTAMGWYTRFVMEWELRPVAAPTLMVHASLPMPGVDGDRAWRPEWPFPHETVDVRGDHFTMLQEHADETARAVEAWLGVRLS